MADRYKLLDETTTLDGVTLRRIYWIAEDREGGWLGPNALLPQDGTAAVYDDALLLNGVFRGGVFWDGVFRGGEFWGGVFRGGVFQDGVFWDGVFRGGEFWGGVFRGGEFQGGVFWDGVFWDGVFRGGVFWSSPCCAQRSDGYMFVAKYVKGVLRIWAGCRNFSWDEAVAHWNDGHKHGAESQRIIHFLKAQAEAERDRDAKREAVQ